MDTDFGFDRIRTSNGAECQHSNATGKMLEMGSFATVDELTQDGNAGVYARVVVQLGMDKVESRRVDCRDLYNMQLRRDELEMQRLKKEIELLEAQKQNLLRQTSQSASVGTGDDW